MNQFLSHLSPKYVENYEEYTWIVSPRWWTRNARVSMGPLSVSHGYCDGNFNKETYSKSQTTIWGPSNVIEHSHWIVYHETFFFLHTVSLDLRHETVWCQFRQNRFGIKSRSLMPNLDYRPFYILIYSLNPTFPNKNKNIERGKSRGKSNNSDIQVVCQSANFSALIIHVAKLNMLSHRVGLVLESWWYSHWLVSISIPFEWLLRSIHRRSKNSCFVVSNGDRDLEGLVVAGGRISGWSAGQTSKRFILHKQVLRVNRCGWVGKLKIVRLQREGDEGDGEKGLDPLYSHPAYLPAGG